MDTPTTFTSRAFGLIAEMWDAVLEEEAILEEAGLESADSPAVSALPGATDERAA